jgi:hypothetical protein
LIWISTLSKKENKYSFLERVDAVDELFYVFEYVDKPSDNSLRSYDLRTGAEKAVKLGELGKQKFTIQDINNGLLLGHYRDSKDVFVFNLNIVNFTKTTVPSGAISRFNKGYQVTIKNVKSVYDENFNLKYQYGETSLDHPELMFFNYASYYSPDGFVYYAGYYRSKLKKSGKEKKKVKKNSKVDGIYFMKFDENGNRILSTTAFKEVPFMNIQSDGVLTEWLFPENSGSDKIYGKDVTISGGKFTLHNNHLVFTHQVRQRMHHRENDSDGSGTHEVFDGNLYREIFSYEYKPNGKLV